MIIVMLFMHNTCRANDFGFICKALIQTHTRLVFCFCFINLVLMILCMLLTVSAKVCVMQFCKYKFDCGHVQIISVTLVMLMNVRSHSKLVLIIKTQNYSFTK